MPKTIGIATTLDNMLYMTTEAVTKVVHPCEEKKYDAECQDLPWLKQIVTKASQSISPSNNWKLPPILISMDTLS